MDRLEAALGEKARRRLRRVLGLMLAGCIGLLAVDESKALTAWYYTRQAIREYPTLAIVPQPLPDTSSLPMEPGTTITLSGCSLDIPRTDIVRRLPGGAFFKGGGGVFLFDPGKALDAAALYRSPGNRGAMQRLLGAETIRSNFNLEAAELASRPSDLTLLAPLPAIARTSVLLLLKVIHVNDERLSAIYSVQMGRVRGFQIGDPNGSPRSITLEMFDQKDRHFNVMLVPGKDSAHPLTQGEINEIVRSMRCEDAAPKIGGTSS